MDSGFNRAARLVVQLLPRDQVERVANWVSGDPHGSDVLSEVTVPSTRQAISGVLAALNLTPLALRPVAADHLRALADGYAMGQSAQHSEIIWTGPAQESSGRGGAGNPLTGLIDEARIRLTFTAGSLEVSAAVASALVAAARRGVTVTVIADYGSGSGQSSPAGDRDVRHAGNGDVGSARNGAVGAAGNGAVSLPAIPGVQIWRWARPARMGGRLAIVDDSTLMVSSADLAQDGASEAHGLSVIVRGGETVAAVLSQLRDLAAAGSIVTM